MHELIIIGGGPAGTAAAVYAARKQLKTLMIAFEFGGQSSVSESIFNWIGTPKISGFELAKSFENHAREYEGDILEIITGKKATSITQNQDKTFTVTTDDGKTYTAKSVLISTGSSRRKLSVPGADDFEHKGVVYCASCDGPLFSGQDVAVIGGGNAGFETAAQLLAYAKSVTLLQRSSSYKADPITVEKVLSHPNMTGILNATTDAVTGEKFVDGIDYTDQNDQQQHLDVTGIFVEIGQIPNTSLAANLVDTDDYNRITIDPWTQKTSVEGLWAAGDCTNVKYHQNNITAGDAVKALEDIYIWLKTK